MLHRHEIKYPTIFQTMKCSIILSLIICVACSSNKGDERFKSFVYDLSKRSDSIEFQKWRLKNITGKRSENYNCHDSLQINSWTWAYCLYEDDSYKILGECRGEFGGSAIFIHKNEPDKANYVVCTCPQMVEKREDGFYITQALAHGIGSGRVIKIEDPKDLITVSVDSLSLPWQKERFKGVDSYEVYTKLENQGQTLIDTIGYTFILFFPHNKQDYLIYSSYSNIFLGEVKNKQIVFFDTLTNFSSWGWIDRPNELVDGIYHNHFERKGTDSFRMYSSGDIYVKQDTIIIGYIYREWPKKKEEL